MGEFAGVSQEKRVSPTVSSSKKINTTSVKINILNVYNIFDFDFLGNRRAVYLTMSIDWIVS